MRIIVHVDKHKNNIVVHKIHILDLIQIKTSYKKIL